MRTGALLLFLLSGAAAGEEWVDGRVTTTWQLFQQSLVPGLPGGVVRVETASPVTLGAFMRFGGGTVGSLDGELSGELAAWGRVGPLDGTVSDGDLATAWVRFATRKLRVKLGRQLALPGSARYVRFDGGSVGTTLLDALDLDAYAGWVVLPRWSLPRGAALAGFVTDALVDPSLVEAQNRAGQITWGARAQLHRGTWQAALAYHEQYDFSGLAYRVVAADARVGLTERAFAGGRLTFDTTRAAFSEARLYVDLATPWLPVSADYSYQNPSLLLPGTSVLAAFGGSPWHELGADATLTLLQSFKLTGRAAAQMFEGNELGGRASVKASWVPELDRRGLVLAELGRDLAPPSGFTFVRAAGRFRLAEVLWLSGDGAVYFYDQPIRGQSRSITGIASLEWTPLPRVRAVLSGTAMSTPWSAFETQLMAKLAIDLGTRREGATP
ncbi:MAG: hypothetical protein QM723_10480 [Myxococcaceae bacterium]